MSSSITDRRRYAAFISYSRSHDSALAAALQNGLEAFAKSWRKSRAVRIFRDVTSLPPSQSLSQALERALDDSDFLILIASPASSDSLWVEQEVEYWLRTRSLSSIIVVAAAGEAVWLPEGQPGSTLPPSLVRAYNTVPNYVDLRAPGIMDMPTLRNPLFLDAVATIGSVLRGIPKDELIGEHIRQHRKITRLQRVAIVLPTILTIVAVLLAVVANNEKSNADREKAQADTQRNAAVSRALAADSQIKSDTDPGSSMVLALAAADISPTIEARSALLQQEVARQRVVRILSATADRANAVAVGGGLIATAAGRGTVDLWDAKNFGMVRVLHTSDDDVSTLAFSSNGRTLAVGGSLPDGEAGSLVLWNPRSGRPISPNLLPSMPPLVDMSYSDSGQRVAMQIEDGSTEVLSSQGKLISLPSSEGYFQDHFCGDISMDPAGSHVIESNQSYGFARWWNINRHGASYGGQISTSTTARTITARKLTQLSDHLELIVTHQIITVLNVNNREPVVSVHTAGPLSCVALSADRRYLAYGLSGGAVNVYDIMTGRSVSLKFHTGQVTGLAFLNDSRLVTSDNTGVVVVWNINPSTAFARPIPGITDATTALYLPRSNDIAVAGRKITYWRSGGGPSAVPSPSAFDIDSMVVLPGGRLAVSDGINVFLQKTARSSFVKLPIGDARGIGPPVAVSPDGTLLVSGGTQQTIRRWNAIKRSIAGETQGDVDGDQDDVTSLAFSPNGQILASGDLRGNPSLWNPRTGRLVVKLMTPQLPGIPQYQAVLFGIGFDQQVAISPDGRSLAASDAADGVVIWDIPTRTVRGVLTDRTSQITAMAFDPVAGLLATGDLAGNVTLWDMSRLEPLGTWPAGVKPIASLAFRADGRRLLSVSYGTVTQWNTDVSDWYHQLCQAVVRPLTKTERSLYAPGLPIIPACRP